MSESAYFNFSGLRGELRYAESMKKHVSWRTGGVVERVFIPADFADLITFMRQLPVTEPVYMVGLGSNLLVRDGGLRGTVILLHSGLQRLVVEGAEDEQCIYAEAGVASPKVARFAAVHGFHGAEFLAGIPGTVGGALAMNAGCYGSETWEIVSRVQTVDRQGVLHVRNPEEYEIAYRHIKLKQPVEEWFVGAWFSLPQAYGQDSRQIIKDLLTRRIAAQPLQLPNAGSVFRNPPGDFAARLIESCGLKGLRIGGAEVSHKHANFIVNPNGAGSAADIEKLIGQIQATVETSCGIRLEREVRIIGESL